MLNVMKPLLLICCAAVLGLAGCNKSDAPATQATKAEAPSSIKMGFLVKQPEEPWFQTEWKFARQAAKDMNFTLMEIGATDGEKALAAIDTLAASGAQGLVICIPDVRLGPAIAAKAKAQNLKLISVDDRFVGADGKYMEDVPYLGISARKIGQSVGKTLYAEMQRRQWPVEETAVCKITFDELDTARERTGGATDALVEAGFPAQKIYPAPQKTADVPGAFDAASVLLTQHPEVKHWLAFGTNDNAVLGAVRAMEGRGFGAQDVIGVGINGTDCISEFKKTNPTGFYGSMLLSAKQHGYQTSEMMYKWIKDGVQPPLDTRTEGILITRENFQQVLKAQGVSE